MSYYVFKHGKDDYAKWAVENAIKNQCCLCQYEYKFQDDEDEFQDGKTVTRIWNILRDIKEGDIIILGSSGNSKKYAWGYAIKPRFENKNLDRVVLNCSEMMARPYHYNFEYRSDNYKGYIKFEDCECFYENLDGAEGWGQRIDVDMWHDYNENSIDYIHNYSFPQGTIHAIDKNDALNIIRKLKNDPNFEFEDKSMENYIELLKSNKNLILTGAPGTGKTHLAKQIANEIIKGDTNKDYDESFENDNDFKEQCAFVQFHPSYDYTDFVEGLRPKNDNGNIGFVRKDGVFKEFCKKALKNLKDSQKDISTLNYDEIIKKYLEDFYNDVFNYINGIKFDFDKSIEELMGIDTKENKDDDDKAPYEIHGIGGGIAAPIIEMNYNKSEAELDFTVKTKNGNEYKFNNKLDLIVDYYKKFVSKKPNEWKYKDFVDTLNVKGYHTYIYGFLKAFYDKYNEKIEQEKNNRTVQEVKKKDFIFIIDEINRGEISKIFGELFFSVDSGYRGEKGKVLTQYANLIEDGDEFKDGFYIPENVYIIGTMNDIDRSVESMDFAMRRRFAWKEIKAENTQETILSDLGDLKEEAIKRMDRLNNAISNIPELSDAYNIGAAYFLKLDKKNKEEAFKKLWDNHLNGLLFEYTRGMSNQKEIIDNLERAYNLNNGSINDNNNNSNSN